MKALTLYIVSALAAAAVEFPAPFDTEKGSGFVEAEKTVAGFTLPPGFRAQVFAAEPDVRQPIAMTSDARGRVWVAENYTYAERPARWEKNLRDRVVILEDKDGDGRAETRKVFWDQGSFLTSVEVGFGGVWALCPPQILFIPDRNGDDVPDGPAEVVLDGFSHGDAIGHNIANGLKWGPDGWLYGRHGILDTSAVGRPGAARSQRTLFNCAIWRYHPTRRIFEVVSNGGTNPWGLDFDQHGQMFYTNTVIGHLWHVIPGGYYRRMYGVHLNPHVYEVIEQTADHFHWDADRQKWGEIKKGPLTSETDQRGGGHVHIGCLIYQGGRWPEAYHHALLTCNLQGNRVNVDTLHRDGCGYVGKHAPDLLRARDTWFRGMELINGPDGNVLIADWSDTGECHDTDGIHRSSGRIYKISYGDAKAATAFDLNKQSNAELVSHLRATNDWFARASRKILQERAAGGMNLDDVRVTLERILLSEENVVHRLRALWTWHSIGATNESVLRRLMDDSSEHVRVWAVRLLGETFNQPEVSSLQKMADLGRADTSGLMRVFLASILQKLPLEARWPIANALSAHAADQTDRQQPLMLWYGMEPAVMAHPEKATAWALAAKIPLIRRHVARRFAVEIERSPTLANNILKAIAVPGISSQVREDVLAGLAAGLRGWSRVAKPEDWDRLLAVLDAENAPKPLRELARELSLLFGSGRAEAELLEIVRNTNETVEARRAAMDSVARNPRPEYLSMFLQYAKDRGLAAQSARALARYDDPRIPVLLLEQFRRAGPLAQPEFINTLVSRPSYAKALLAEVGSGQLSRDVITPYQARQIRSLDDAALTQTLSEVWGELRDASADKKDELSRWQTRLTPEKIRSGSPSRGHATFTRLCAACHKLHGEGGTIGPDLTGSDRHNLNYLLENILDPSGVVPSDYRLTILKLNDGRTLSGTVLGDSSSIVTLQTPTERLQIPRRDVSDLQPLAMSLMPEGLLQSLTEDEVGDLFSYLMSDQPRPAAR